MENLSLLMLFISAASLGGLIGVLVERNKDRLFIPGVRTHIIVASLGCLSYLLYSILNLEYIVYALFASVILFVLHENEIKIYKKTDLSKFFQNSFLYELLIVISFINGLLVASEYFYLSVFITFFVCFLLYITPNIHSFSKQISQKEIHSTLFFIFISIILLPMLPNINYDISLFSFLQFLSPNFLAALSSITILNPFKIWLLVVIISGLSFCSYIAMKLLGERKGLFLTSFLGGIVSSTALTSSFAISSKNSKKISNILAGGIILASCIMFVRVFIEILIISPQLAFKMAFPLILTPLVGITLIYFFMSNEKEVSKKEPLENKLSLNSPFEIKPALYFTSIFVLVLVLSSLSLFFFSEKGLYFTAIISGLVDIDAITLSTSALYAQLQINELVAMITISLGIISNTLIKAGIAYFLGSKELRKKTTYYFLILICVYCISFATLLI